MRLLARPLAAAAVLSVALLTTAGCLWDDAKNTQAAGESDDAKAGLPKAAQVPRPGAEPLFHVTSATGGTFHELEIAGPFKVRFACKGSGAAAVSLGGTAKYEFTCSKDGAEQSNDHKVTKPGPQRYRVEVTTDAKNTWSIFFDRGGMER